MDITSLIASGLFSWLLAFALAIFEVEIEGKEGWAFGTATWYRVRGRWARIVGVLLGGKPVTGYHLVLNAMVVLLFAGFLFAAHWPAVPGWRDVLLQFARYLVFVPVWDFSWFLLNPAYAGKIRPEYAWWHASQRWIGPSPWSNVASVVVSMIIAALIGELQPQLVYLACFGAGLFFTLGIAPMYRRWLLRMQEQDERYCINKLLHGQLE